MSFEHSAHALVLLAALAACACAGDPPVDDGQSTTSQGESDESGPSDESGTSQTSASETGETGSPAPTLVVVVDAIPPYPELIAPAVGAVVALDTSQGRLEATTDDQGRASFEGFEWGGESVDVSVGLTDYVLRSQLGMTEADANEAGELVLDVFALGKSEDTIEVSGPILNKALDSHDVIAGIGGYDSFWAPDPQWSASIAPDQPFSLVALELWYLAVPPGQTDNPIFGWFTAEHPGASMDTQLSIDFAMPTMPSVAAGSFLLPERPDSPLRADNFGFVYALAELGGGPLIGRSIYTEVSPDGDSCAYDVEYVTPAAAVEPVTCHRIVAAEGMSTSCLPGFPGDGPQDVELLDVTSVAFVADRSLYEPVEFELHDVGVTPQLRITYGPQLLWIVTGPEDATSLTVPQPPSGFDTGGATLDMNLWLGRLAPDGDTLEAWSSIPPFSGVG